VLLAEFWDPSSGAVFSEEGDQQRFWKLTRRFVEGLAAGGAAERVKVVSSPRRDATFWEKWQHRKIGSLSGTTDAAHTPRPCSRHTCARSTSAACCRNRMIRHTSFFSTQDTESCLQLYPDIGVAAMLRNQWQDVQFRIGSLGDRAIVAPDDEIVVLAAPDPQGKRLYCRPHRPYSQNCSGTRHTR